LLIAGEPGKQTVLNPVISPLGVQLMDGILVQKSSDNPPNMVKPLLTNAMIGIAKNLEREFSDSIGVSMPGAVGLSYTTGGPFSIKPLLITDEKASWNKKGKLVVDSADVDFSAADGDERGSVATAVALTRQINNKEQRIVVTGDADFLTNREITRFRAANFKFDTDLFGWFTYGQFPVDTSRPESRDKRLDITDKGMLALKIFILSIFPGLLLIIATVFLIRRKRK
jgi:ABC-2 type transport system permease protein